MRKAEKGSVLVMVMVTMAALLILGVVLANTGSAEILGTSRQEQKMKAFYLARSGAEAVASSIIKDPGLAGTISDQGFSDPKDLGGGNFKVKVEPSGADRLLITSTGKFRRAEETVTLILDRANVGVDLLFDRVIFSNNDLNISHNNADVTGDIESRGSIIGKQKIENKGYKAYENSTRVYPPPIFPSDIDPTNNKLEAGNGTKNIYGDGYYKTISTGPNGAIKVYTNGGDIRVVAETVDIKGDLQVVDGGRLLLFVHGDATFQTPHSATAGSLIVFMLGNGTATIQAHGWFNGYIYAPDATVNLNSGAVVHGAVIAKQLVKGSDNKFQGTLVHIEGMEGVPVELEPYIPDIGDVSYQRGDWGK